MGAFIHPSVEDLLKLFSFYSADVAKFEYMQHKSDTCWSKGKAPKIICCKKTTFPRQWEVCRREPVNIL